MCVSSNEPLVNALPASTARPERWRILSFRFGGLGFGFSGSRAKSRLSSYIHAATFLTQPNFTARNTVSAAYRMFPRRLSTTMPNDPGEAFSNSHIIEQGQHLSECI